MRRKRIIQSAGLALLALVLSACSGAEPPQQSGGGGAQTGLSATPAGASTSQSAQKIKRGGMMTRSDGASMASMDPAMGLNAHFMWNYIGTFMLRREPDTWKLVGDAIEKWEFSDGGKTLTLHVRPGVKWQNLPPVNGRDMEAKDIVYTLRSITGLQYPDMPPLRFPRKSNLEEMQDAVAVDKNTVKVTLKNPSSSFLDGLADYRSPITPDQVREHFGARESLTNPSPERYLSAGPFVLTKFQDLQEAIYSRYPDYWEKGEDGQSKPYVDGVRQIWIQDTGTQIAAFSARQTSFIGTGVGNVETRNQIMASRKDAQMIMFEPTSCWHRVAWNTTRKPFDDLRVRQAVSLVIDPIEIGKTIYGDFDGKAVWRAPGPLPWSYPEAIPQEELLKQPYYETPKSQKTIDQAKKLLADAGITDMSFELITSTSATNRDPAILVQNQITRALPNVKIKVSPIDNAIQLERAAKGDYDAQYYCYIHEPTAVAMMKTAFHSKGGRNVARLNDTKMDDLLDRASTELDNAKRAQVLREAQMRVFETLTMTPTVHNATIAAFQPEVRGIRLGSGTLGEGMFAKEFWLDK